MTTPWPSSLRARLTLWYTVLLCVPLILFAVASYVAFAQALQSRTDRFIGDALTAFARELDAERRAALTVVQAMQSTVDEVRFRDLHVAILDTTGHVVARSQRPTGDVGDDRLTPDELNARMLAALARNDQPPAAALTFPTEYGGFRVMSRPFDAGAEHFRLTGTYALRDNESVLAQIREMFLVAIPLLVLAAATGGYFLAKRSLAPVASMAARAVEISATTLHERLPVGGGDELVRLATVVNDLLDRLEQSFAQQRRFVTDASHELRTPTAIVRTEADVTLSRPHRTEDEYRTSVAIMQDAAQRLTRIVDDLFLLARADSGHLVMHPAALYLDELVHDATLAVRSVASQRGVQVEVHQLVEAPFRGDADLLGRLLLNLLDNAIKYSPSAGTVEVSMMRREARCEISVVDAGPGIPDDARERIFERFYRVDTARSRAESSATSGAGLGLAIARRIADMHGGRLELADSRPGRTTFRFSVPIVGSD